MDTLEDGKKLWKEKTCGLNLTWQTSLKNRYLPDQV